jgi:hypothetical protein
MAVTITNYDFTKRLAIESAAEEEWDFGDWNRLITDRPKPRHQTHAEGEGCLGGGETEEEFAKRLSVAIIKANGAPCHVRVVATCLDDLPCNVHECKEESLWEEIKNQKKEED